MVPSRTPETISAALLAPFPTDVIEDKQGMAYIGHEYVRMRLIEATGNQFNFSLDFVEYRNDGAIRDRADKTTGEMVGTSVCVVMGTLTIPDLGSRSDQGVQEIQSGGGADSAYKGAVSDCLKRCAMGFGVGLQQLYIDTGKPGQAALRNQPAQNAPQSTVTHAMASRAQLVEIAELARTAGLSDAQRDEFIGMPGKDVTDVRARALVADLQSLIAQNKGEK